MEVMMSNPAPVEELSQGSLSETLSGKYMTFKLSAEEYGLQILNVRELIGLMSITRVPRTEPFMKGVINLRGRVIPVIDLRLKFGMDEVEATDQTVIIVVQVKSGDHDLTMGLIVDEVLEVLDIGADQVEPPPVFGQTEVETDFILGVGKAGQRVVFLLDINKVLTGQELSHLATHA